MTEKNKEVAGPIAAVMVIAGVIFTMVIAVGNGTGIIQKAPDPCETAGGRWFYLHDLSANHERICLKQDAVIDLKKAHK